MAWFRWRKNAPTDETPELEPAAETTAVGTDVLEAEPTIEPEPALDPDPAFDPDPVPVPEPVLPDPVVPEPEPTPEPEPLPDLEPTPDLAPAPEPFGADSTLQVAEALVPSDAPPPVLAWNAGLRGVVVRIVHTAPSPAGSAADLRAALENGLAAAVGEQSPAPADADPEFPIVLNVTIAEETVDAEVAETLASARKQLARRAARVRLVIDQAPLAEIV